MTPPRKRSLSLLLALPIAGLTAWRIRGGEAEALPSPGGGEGEGYRFEAVATYEDIALHDPNEVLRETARRQLAADNSAESFEAWWRVSSPGDAAFPAEALQMAARLADPGYGADAAG